MKIQFLKSSLILLVQILVGITCLAQYSQVGSKLIGTRASNGTYGASQGCSVSLSSDGNTLAVGGFNDSSGVGAVWVYTFTGSNWIQSGNKLVGSDALGAAKQGWSVSLSSDGYTLAIGGPDDNGSMGAVWIFTLSGSNWMQVGDKLVGTETSTVTYQGQSVSLSSDGKTLAVGGYADNNYTGAVWVYTFTGGNWGQLGNKLVGSDCSGYCYQGWSVSLSSDGKTLAVGGYADSSYAGAVWMYSLSGNNWTQVGRKLVGSGADNGSNGASQGWSVSLSSDGGNLAVGGANDSSGVGAVWIYTFTGSNWKQVGSKLVGTGTMGNASQGSSVRFSADGKTLAVGGYTSTDNANNFTGAAWIYTLTGSNWNQVGTVLVGTDAVGNSNQGWSVSLSSDGKTLAIGGDGDSSGVGAVWVFYDTGIITTGIYHPTFPQTNPISVYPNPFGQAITIKSLSMEELPYTFYDIQGGETETGFISSSHIGSLLKPGIYLLKVNASVFKVVKMQ
jgi:hypothetical protein